MPLVKTIHGNLFALSVDPWLMTSLAFSRASGASGPTEDDNILTGIEARGLRLEGTQLVVLSDCTTGSGDAPRNRGVLAMRTAFRAAGAKHVISSLWETSDTFTSDFMVEFHEQVAAGMAPTQALRRAQLKSLRKGDPPGQWATFIHTGDTSRFSEVR